MSTSVIQSKAFENSSPKVIATQQPIPSQPDDIESLISRLGQAMCSKGLTDDQLNDFEAYFDLLEGCAILEPRLPTQANSPVKSESFGQTEENGLSISRLLPKKEEQMNLEASLIEDYVDCASYSNESPSCLIDEMLNPAKTKKFGQVTSHELQILKNNLIDADDEFDFMVGNLPEEEKDKIRALMIQAVREKPLMKDFKSEAYEGPDWSVVEDFIAVESDASTSLKDAVVANDDSQTEAFVECFEKDCDDEFVKVADDASISPKEERVTNIVDQAKVAFSWAKKTYGNVFSNFYSVSSRKH